VAVVVVAAGIVAALMGRGDSGRPDSGATPSPAVTGDTSVRSPGDAALDQAMDDARRAITALTGDPVDSPSAVSPHGDGPDTEPPGRDDPVAPAAPRLEASGAPADDPDAPRFDVVRVDPEGRAVIAGRAAPGATVTILDGTREVGRADADDRGQWVFVAEDPLPPGDRQLSLQSRGGRLQGMATPGILDSSGLAPGVEGGSPALGRASASTSATDAAMDAAMDPVPNAAVSMAAGPLAPDVPAALGLPHPAQGIPGTPPTADLPATHVAMPVAAPVTIAVTATAAPRRAPETAQAVVRAIGPPAAIPADARPGHSASHGASDGISGSPRDATERRSPTVVVVSIPQPRSGMPVLAVETPREAYGGARVLQGPTAPVAEGRLRVGTVDYSASGGLTLSGTARPGATVHLYLDNRPLARVEADSGGTWTATPRGGDIEARLYTLRADEVTGDGVVGQRVELPFQRANLDLRATAEGETMIVVQPGNNLWTVARTVYGEGTAYTTIYRANDAHIRDPDLIYPGQVFVIPRE